MGHGTLSDPPQQGATSSPSGGPAPYRPEPKRPYLKFLFVCFAIVATWLWVAGVIAIFYGMSSGHPHASRLGAFAIVSATPLFLALWKLEKEMPR